MRNSIQDILESCKNYHITGSSEVGHHCVSIPVYDTDKLTDEFMQLICDKMTFAFSKAIQYYERDFPRLLDPHGFTNKEIANAIQKLKDDNI